MIETNIILGYKITDVDDSEPVEKEELKSHFPIDFPDYDTVISLCLTSARQWAEKEIDQTLIPDREITVIFECFGHYGVHLPFGPVKEVISVHQKQTDGQFTAFDEYDELTSDAGYMGNQLLIATPGIYRVVYKAGQSPIPEDIRQAIKSAAAYFFEHRGEELEDRGRPYLAESLLSKYKYTLL